MDDPKPRTRRWHHFSLRTMFVAVTVLCCWFAHQLNWMRQRREAISRSEAIVLGSDRPVNILAPKMLWLFGEPGRFAIGLYTADMDRPTAEELRVLARLEKLFPEAELLYLSFDNRLMRLVDD